MNPPVSGSSSEVSSSSSIEIQDNSSSSLGCIYGETLYDNRDGATYKTVVVGNQIWMAENLNFERPIEKEKPPMRSICYAFKDSLCEVYGRLYPWTVAIDSALLDTTKGIKCGTNALTDCSLPSKWKGICPEGWHLPTKTEWRTLISYVGGSDVAGKKLKSATLWDGEDAVCFSALPGGRFGGGSYGLGEEAFFWMASFKKTYSPGAYSIFMVSGEDAHGSITVDPLSLHYFVRCIKD